MEYMYCNLCLESALDWRLLPCAFLIHRLKVRPECLSAEPLASTVHSC